MNCKKCGAEIPQGKLFCGKCGAKVMVVSVKNKKDNFEICPSCKNFYDITVGRCSFCGYSKTKSDTSVAGYTDAVANYVKRMSVTPKIRCPECGERIDGGVGECPHCKYDFKHTNKVCADSRKQNTNQNNSGAIALNPQSVFSIRNMLIFIAILVAVLITIMIIGNIERCTSCGQIITEGYEFMGQPYCNDCLWK